MLLVSGTLRLSSNQMSIFFKVLFFAYCICLISAPSRNVTVWGDEFNFETAFSSTNNESQWLLEHPTTEAFFAYGAWKLNILFGDKFSASDYFRACRDASPHCNYSNVEFFALWLYFVGPSHMGVDHNPLSYYQSCGKYRISEYMFNEGGRCSFKDLIKVIGSAYECELSSIRYENRRSLEVQGQFGVYGITAGIFLCATPVITFAIVMGSLNLIVLRQIRKAAENGGRSLVFHQLNVGCDVAAAFLSISPQFFVIGNLATTIYRAFTGTCLSTKAVSVMNSAHWIFKDALLDLGLVALALLASDRLQAMKNPVEYLATSDKTRFHRCIGAAILIITIHGIDAVAMLKDDGYIRWYDLLELVMQLVRTTYLLVCIYVVFRCTMGMIVRLRTMNAQHHTNSVESNDSVRRSASLDLQICILNVISLQCAAIAAFWFVLVLALRLANFWNTYAVMWGFYLGFIKMPQFAMLVFNSNIGFIVHYYYSRMYQDAAGAAFAPMKQRFESGWANLLAKNSVGPVSTTIELR